MKEYKDCTVQVSRLENGSADISWKRNYPIPDDESEDSLEAFNEEGIDMISYLQAQNDQLRDSLDSSHEVIKSLRDRVHELERIIGGLVDDRK